MTKREAMTLDQLAEQAIKSWVDRFDDDLKSCIRDALEAATQPLRKTYDDLAEERSRIIVGAAEIEHDLRQQLEAQREQLEQAQKERDEAIAWRTRSLALARCYRLEDALDFPYETDDTSKHLRIFERLAVLQREDKQLQARAEKAEQQLAQVTQQLATAKVETWREAEAMADQHAIWASEPVRRLCLEWFSTKLAKRAVEAESSTGATK